MKKTALTFLLLLLLYIGVLFYPNPLFSHSYVYNNYRVYSDRAIPKEIENILDDVESRISKSELYDTKDKHHIFICNSSWRFMLFARSNAPGGIVNFIAPNVFIRESDIKKNKIIKEKPIYSPEIRTLAYYMAHEITHVMQQKISQLMPLKSPKYIVEGYADYIGKLPNFEYKQYLEDYKNHTKFMDIKSGMYNRYHLLIAHLMQKRGMSYKEVVEQGMSMEEVEHDIMLALKKY